MLLEQRQQNDGAGTNNGSSCNNDTDTNNDTKKKKKKREGTTGGPHVVVGEECLEEYEVDLQKTHAGRKIWLIKVSDFVAKEWIHACRNEGGSGEVLGRLKIDGGGQHGGDEEARSGSKSSDMSVQLMLSHPSTDHLPQTYDMNVSSRWGPPMMAFSERDGGMARSVEGVVQHRLTVDARSHANMKQSGFVGQGDAMKFGGANEEYRKLARQRFKDSDPRKGKRGVQIMTDSKIVDIRKPIGIDVAKLGVQKKRAVAEKRIALPKEELLPLMFRLFQKQPRWRFAQLQKETDQPTQHLRGVLMEIASQNRAGPYKDLWELNKESQVHTSGPG